MSYSRARALTRARARSAGDTGALRNGSMASSMAATSSSGECSLSWTMLKIHSIGPE